MKSAYANGSAVQTINEVEEGIQSALEDLRTNSVLPEALRRALCFLAPNGYRPIVELQGGERKKRRTASADSWSPATDEIRIYFEPALPATVQTQIVSQPKPYDAKSSQPPPSAVPHSTQRPVPSFRVAPDSFEPVTQLLEALAEAERGGRAFIALKWFRDDFLPAKGFDWTLNAEQRQTVLAQAIESGAVLTSRIPNPKAPMYPTSTIKLSRAERSVPSNGQQRFRPIPVYGEPVSTTISRDRGVR